MNQYTAMGWCCLSIILPLFAFAQSPDTSQGNPFLWGVQAHRGFILPHSTAIANVSHSNPFGLEIRGMWLRAEDRHTRQSGLVTQRGFLVNYINFDNPEVLGHSASAVALIEPLIRPGGRLYGSVQMGAGVTFLSKVYDETTNPTNLFFSTLLSFTGMVNAKLYYRINPHCELSLGYNYNHISNGGMKLPNKGMNFPMANVGFQYHFRPITLKRPLKTDEWKQQSRNYAYVLGISSIKRHRLRPISPPTNTRF
ncbi:MAG: acyloxyacyl hydrolase [Saprospiraceae bacterium]|nr:acyloxyacyl hydrolase [Saprospiraceae bacterium]